MTDKESFFQFIETSLNQLDLHKEICVESKVEKHTLEIHDQIIDHFKITKDLIIEKEIPINYIKQFYDDLNHTLQYLPYRNNQNLDFLQHNNKTDLKEMIERQTPFLENQIIKTKFNFEFFNKLNFFSSNIVAIGANGSGKTTLSNDLKRYLPNTGVVISAQKVLIIPTFSGISNFDNTNQKLQQSQISDKSLKVTYSTESNGNSWSIMNQIGGEFQILLDNLLAERNVIRNQFFDSIESGLIIKNTPITKLDKTIKIWNYLIQHRTLECKDGINIGLKTISGTESYPAHQMSDGEKVVLYLIAHVLQAPMSGFIIIDEPETYLHKTILKKLWDRLEQERQDCIFVYLTHDLDFATSRTTAKKIWIKSFSHPDKWEIEDIPSNELPESLLLELLGSRKNILFCEGKKGKIDEKIYNILFPDFTITPVDSCFSVINYTKAFNKLQNVTTKAIGLIDSDHHGSVRLKALEPENIFSFSMTEPENLFLDEEFLRVMSMRLYHDDLIVENIKSDVILQLQNEIELQVSNYVSTKINYYFKDSHVSKGNTLAKVNDNYVKFTNEIKIQEWYDERLSELNEIINNQDYPKALTLFNNKGLMKIANKHFKISDFIDKSIKILQFQPETHYILKRHFPSEITKKNELHSI